jgi:hypothetical protein
LLTQPGGDRGLARAGRTGNDENPGSHGSMVARPHP